MKFRSSSQIPQKLNSSFFFKYRESSNGGPTGSVLYQSIMSPSLNFTKVSDTAISNESKIREYRLL